MEYISILKDGMSPAGFDRLSSMVPSMKKLNPPLDVDLSTEHRYLRLPHPRTGQPQLHLPYTTEEGGDAILEVVRINCAHRRTWFIGDDKIDGGALLMHVPIDPLFLVIPIVLSLITSSTATHFQPLPDLIAQASVNPDFALPEPFSREAVKSGSGFNEDVARLLALKSTRRVFRLCCEKKVVPAAPLSPTSSTADENLGSSSKTKGNTYYRPSQTIILNHLKRKVDHFAQPEQYEKFDHLVRGLGKDGLLEVSADQELVRRELFLHIALNTMCFELKRAVARIKGSIEHLAHYLPSELVGTLNEAYDFTPLNTYLANRTAAQMAAAAPITQSKSEAALKAGAKRKAPAASRGVESLKKVNTSSMSKLTSFFKPKNGEKK